MTKNLLKNSSENDKSRLDNQKHLIIRANIYALERELRGLCDIIGITDLEEALMTVYHLNSMKESIEYLEKEVLARCKKEGK